MLNSGYKITHEGLTQKTQAPIPRGISKNMKGDGEMWGRVAMNNFVSPHPLWINMPSHQYNTIRALRKAGEAGFPKPPTVNYSPAIT